MWALSAEAANSSSFCERGFMESPELEEGVISAGPGAGTPGFQARANKSEKLIRAEVQVSGSKTFQLGQGKRCGNKTPSSSQGPTHFSPRVFVSIRSNQTTSSGIADDLVG